MISIQTYFKWISLKTNIDFLLMVLFPLIFSPSFTIDFSKLFSLIQEVNKNNNGTEFLLL